MRTELAPQWDLVEDEVSPVFEILLDTVKDNLKYLKDEVEGQYHRACEFERFVNTSI